MPQRDNIVNILKHFFLTFYMEAWGQIFNMKKATLVVLVCQVVFFFLNGDLIKYIISL